MRKVLSIVLLSALASAAAAQDPNLQRGFSPGKMYDLLGLDSVNTLNGNLNLRIPLGQKYTAGPVLQYQFMLAYNSKIWEFEYFYGTPPPGAPRKNTVPDRRANAGLGWRLTLGELHKPTAAGAQPPTTGWEYVGADGSSHEFPTLDSDPGTVYSRDGSFLRLRRIPETGTLVAREIDFPDGTIHRFVFESGKSYARVRKISDRYGNWVSVDYGASQWTVADGYGNTVARTHTIVIERPLDGEGDDLYNQENYKTRPVELKLASAGSGGVATYTLEYDDTTVPIGICAGRGTSSLQYARVPLLTSIEQPDGTTYAVSYQEFESQRCTSGVLAELRLPTRGTIAWQHGSYELPFQQCVMPFSGDDEEGWVGSYAGVTRRTLKNESGDVVETRSYTPLLIEREWQDQKCSDSKPIHYLPLPPEEFRNTVTVTVPEGGTEKTIEKTTHYFSVFPANGSWEGSPPEFALSVEYGLPFTRRESNGQRFLSSQVYSCSGGTCSGDIARTSYLAYEYDLGVFTRLTADDPRVKAQRTVFNSDACDQASCRYYTDMEHDEWDGYGHFKKTTHTSNLGGTSRTLRTEYTPDASAWLMGKYSGTSVIENNTTRQEMTYTWDHAGQMRSRRVLDLDTTGAVGDLLSVTCRDSRGYVASEKWLGGDGRTPPADTADLCASTVVPAEKEYAIEHEYPSGDGFRWWHKAKYRGTLHYIVDEEFDTKTGQVTKTRDSAGLTTTYAYDTMGRFSSITPPGAAVSSFTYRNASSTETARVTSTTGSGVTMEQTYDYDGLGRLFREKRKMPDGLWALRKTDYRGAAATKFTSEWVTLAAGGDENLVDPTIGTTFEHDQFGRTTKVTTPDNKIAITSYVNNGVRQASRTQSVATPLGDRSVTVTETYDMYGKLVSVSEPAGPTTAAAPIGGIVQTDYTYDSDGKLLTVTMTPPAGTAQLRQFDYGSRGLLTSEKHPEKDAVLLTTYDSFDARGHAGTATDADVTTSFEYDNAERLTHVRNATGAILKEFVFGTSADCTYCGGKLRKAIRHNYLPGLGDHQVTETYTYGANGQPSKRETLVETGSYQIQKFSQDFAYDEFLALDRIDYPTCTLPGCSTMNGLASVDHTRTRGLLTGVTGFASISYHPSGMVKTVQRPSTAMIDTYDADQGMARPSKITFSGATACALPSSPAINATSFACAGSSGNQASISSPQSGVVYTWTIQNGTLASTTGTTVTFTAGASGQVVLTAKATKACGAADSAPKTITIPSATITGSSATINAGGSAYIDVTLTGTPPWSLTWSDGVVSSNITPSPFRRTVSPSTTTTYQLTAASDSSSCSLVRSGSATITVRPPAPGWITAQATDRTVEVRWQQVGANRYDVERADNVSPFSWTPVATAISALSVVDIVPAEPGGARRAYVYRVHTVAPDGTRSPVESSPRDYAVTATTMYPSGAITARSTIVQAQHIVELRRGIDALRKLVNLPEVFASQPAPTGWVTAPHFTSLLAPLDAARAQFGYGALAYSNGIARPALGVVIKAEHITQLREVLK